MRHGSWSLVAVLVATLVLVGVAAEEHDSGSVTDTHHAVTHSR